jgi:uncharacterized protein (TIGR02118 family)
MELAPGETRPIGARRLPLRWRRIVAMQKIITAVRRAPALAPEAFGQRYLAALHGLCEQRGTGLRRCIANLVDVPAAESGRPEGEATPYDAVVECWWEVPGSERQLEELHRKLALTADAFSYAVDEVMQKDCAPSVPAGRRSPGIKGIYAVVRRAGLTPEQFARHWREVHGPLALAHHVGMSRYVQDVVQRALTPGAQPFDGFSELHFPTARDMRERFIDSPEGGRRIAEDVAKFVGEAIRLDSSEYVLAG